MRDFGQQLDVPGVGFDQHVRDVKCETLHRLIHILYIVLNEQQQFLNGYKPKQNTFERTYISKEK
jgi:hypothetical protein